MNKKNNELVLKKDSWIKRFFSKFVAFFRKDKKENGEKQNNNVKNNLINHNEIKIQNVSNNVNINQSNNGIKSLYSENKGNNIKNSYYNKIEQIKNENNNYYSNVYNGQNRFENINNSSTTNIKNGQNTGNIYNGFNKNSALNNSFNFRNENYVSDLEINNDTKDNYVNHNECRYDISDEKISINNLIKRNDLFVPEYSYKKDIDMESEKKRIFSLYKGVKENRVKLETLSTVDILLVNQLLKNEIGIYEKKVKS